MEYSVLEPRAGIGGERDDGVGGVEADADEVNLRRFRHGLTVNELGWLVGCQSMSFGRASVAVLRMTSSKASSVEGFFGADVDGADAALVGDVDEAGGGIDGAGGADDEEDGGAVEFAVDGVHVERDFAEPDDVRADGGVAGFADGESRWGLRRRTGRRSVRW